MDEIWVPSSFLVEVFASGGVPREKLVVVPIPIDTQFYSPLPFLPSSSSSSSSTTPSQLRPLSLPNRGGFNFLSVFKWEQRKGWDVLLDAYLAEFKPEVHACDCARMDKAGRTLAHTRDVHNCRTTRHSTSRPTFRAVWGGTRAASSGR